MEPYIKITKKFTKMFGSKAINRQYFHRNTRLQTFFTTIAQSSAAQPYSALRADFYCKFYNLKVECIVHLRKRAKCQQTNPRIFALVSTAIFL